MRTIRALNDEAFDVVHVHEPLAPGPPMTSVLMHPAPVVGTFHAAGKASSYQIFGWFVRWASQRIDRKVVVSKDALELVQAAIPGDYDILFNGVEIDEIRSTVPTPTTHPTIFFCGRHEQRKGLAVLLEAFQSLRPDARLWIASDGPDTGHLRAQYGHDDPHQLARADQRRREVRPPPRGVDLLRPVAAR